MPDRIVVATLEGRDPQLKNEYVIVSAHFDHDGADGPRIYNGADDDGSGTVGLLEIAEAYAMAAKAGQRPKRSIMFAAWNSEERGLLGAWAYTEDPVVPLDRIVAVLNMDMIGRNEEVPAGGGARFRGLELQTAESNENADEHHRHGPQPRSRAAALEKANQRDRRRDEVPLRQQRLESDAPQRPLAVHSARRAGVWVHTGLHPDYHTIYDRPEKINYSEDGEDRAPRVPGELGSGQRDGSPQAAAADKRYDGDTVRLMTRVTLCLLVALLTLPIAAQERVDPAMVAKIRAEAMDRGKVLETFDHLANVVGPRLTNSPAHKRAVAWTQETLKGWGLSNVHAEPFEFGRGWTLERLSIEMIEPRYMPLTGYPRAWSPSTSGTVTASPVWLLNPTADALKAKASQLRGAIVMTSPVQDYFIRADRPAASGDLRSARPPNKPAMPAADLQAALKREGVGVVLEPNIGEHGTIFVTGRDAGANAVPAIVLVSEHYNLIARLLQQGVPVKLAVNIQSRFDDADRNTYNVIAEIPGVDPVVGQEIVMAGAHLDSWHSATGATDNADGAATIMEAVRILKTLGVRPRRTIRIALWAGEEQGLLGSRAYVEQHLAGDKNAAAREKFSVYFNFDNGFPPITGFYARRQRACQDDLRRVDRAARGSGRDGESDRRDRFNRSPVVQARRPARLPGGAELPELRRAHAPHQRGFRGAHRTGGPETGLRGNRGSALPGGDERGTLPTVKRNADCADFTDEGRNADCADLADQSECTAAQAPR